MRSRKPRTPGGAPSRLFTYGTLMRGFRLHHLLGSRARYLGPAHVEGRIVDLGSYPGAMADRGARLHGEVYEIADPTLLATLDSVEGAQYHRREVTVRSDDGHEMAAWIYWYIGPLDRGVPIPGGDYRAHAPATSIYHQPSL